MTDILDRDATSQLAALAARQVSSVELLEAALGRTTRGVRLGFAGKLGVFPEARAPAPG